ncbi:hypothetical protein N8654_02150 [Synechococcus sp. AH-601-B19]|nr:hypothetical protein [Synechococcus sp. AH-601-B19]
MSKRRMAMDALGKLGNLIKGDLTNTQLATRLAPDALFGVMAAAQTPGDIGDKLIAGTASTIGGGLGGLATSRVVGKLGGGEGLQQMADFAGSIGGDFAGMYAGDMTQRGKDLVMGGKGQTPWEKMGEQQQAEYAADLEQQILRQYGLLPGSREQYAQADPNLMVRYADPATGMGVA